MYHIISLIVLAFFGGFVFPFLLLIAIQNHLRTAKYGLKTDKHGMDVHYWKSEHCKRTFIAEAGIFKVAYTLSLRLERVDDTEFRLYRMLEEKSKDALIDAFNSSHVQTRLGESGCRFGIGLYVRDGDWKRYSAHPKLYRCDETTEFKSKLILNTQLTHILNKEPLFTAFGCTVQVELAQKDQLNAKLINENYAMLTDEQKQAVESEKFFIERESLMAIAIVKRQQQFLEGKEQTHLSDDYVIDTEIAGRALKISWSFHSKKLSDGELVGFRKTGGFYPDQWDDRNNGLMVVHSRTSGEVIEYLPEKEPHFYTFFVRKKDARRIPIHSSGVRFQARVPGKDELSEVEALLQKLENKSEANGAVSKSLKELNLVMEFHEEIDLMERSFIERIKRKGMPPEEEEEKIDFIRDIVRSQREKYQP